MTEPTSATEFEQLFLPLRGLLLAHAYKLTGSYADAEDIVQNALLRAWKGRGGLRDHLGAKKWAFQIVTNEALRHLRSVRPRRIPPENPQFVNVQAGEPQPEVLWIEPFPMEAVASPLLSPEETLLLRHEVEYAFIHALQSLTPLQRGVFLLQTAGFSLEEIAETLGSTPPAVSSALQRAKSNVRARRKARPSGVRRDVLDRYLAAWMMKDIHALSRLLAQDVRYSMPPWAEWYQGASMVSRFFAEAWTGYQSFVGEPVALNGTRGVVVWTRAGADMRVHSVHLVLGDAEIDEIVLFRGETALRPFQKPFQC